MKRLHEALAISKRGAKFAKIGLREFSEHINFNGVLSEKIAALFEIVCAQPICDFALIRSHLGG